MKLDDLNHKRRVALIKQEAELTITAVAALAFLSALLLAMIALIASRPI